MGDKEQKQSAPKSNLLLIFFTVLFTLGLLVLGGFGFWFYQENIAKKPEPSPSPSVTPEIVPTVEPTVMPTPEPSPSSQVKSDLELIKEAFAEKYNKPLEDVDVTINKNTGTHASGLIKFAGEISGAMWLGYKDNGAWTIVHDGQGTIPCQAIEPYNFPVDMVPECWDENTNQLIKRN